MNKQIMITQDVPGLYLISSPDGEKIITWQEMNAIADYLREQEWRGSLEDEIDGYYSAKIDTEKMSIEDVISECIDHLRDQYECCTEPRPDYSGIIEEVLNDNDAWEEE